MLNIFNFMERFNMIYVIFSLMVIIFLRMVFDYVTVQKFHRRMNNEKAVLYKRSQRRYQDAYLKIIVSFFAILFILYLLTFYI